MQPSQHVWSACGKYVCVICRTEVGVQLYIMTIQQNTEPVECESGFRANADITRCDRKLVA